MKLLLTIVGSVLLGCATVACSASAQDDSAEAQWPIDLDLGNSKVVLYELQPESLSGDQLSARAAVSLRRTKDAEPIFGAVWVDARVQTDRDARTVTLLDARVPNVQFPAATPQERADLTLLLQTRLPALHATLSLDELISTLDSGGAVEASGLRDDPPKILFAERPTALVTLDGPPELRAVEGTPSGVMRVLNTPFIILFDPALKTYYLKAGEHWRRSDAIEGPWRDEPNPPEQITSAVPRPDAASTTLRADALVDDVDVIVVTEPTELIVTRGAATWTPLPGSDLLYLANSENDVFWEPATRTFYVLLSGRWYASSELGDAAWKHLASDELPKAFALIPEDSPKAAVRTFVAGTTEAREAVLDASIPQTTAVKRDDAHCRVTYDGEPSFAPIPGTSLSYAVNTSASVIEIDGRYFCCTEGVWYVSDRPTGPWRVATSVPDEIGTIPPSCPIYPVRYVHIYDTTPEYVYVGYLPGYTGCYVHGATIVYGTGYWYPGWIGVTYFPQPCTWGFHAYFDPWYCGWSFGYSYAWGLNPWWFNHSCGWGGPGWWGPSGLHAHNFAIHGSVVTSSVPVLVRHGDASVARTSLGRENIYARESNRSRLAGSSFVAATSRTSTRTTEPNDVFAAKDGRVLRRTSDGWQERERDAWTRVDPKTSAGSVPGRGVEPPAGPDRSAPAAGRLAPPESRATPPPARGIPDRSPPSIDRSMTGRASSRSERASSAAPLTAQPGLRGTRPTAPEFRPAPPTDRPAPTSRPDPPATGVRPEPPAGGPPAPDTRPAPPSLRPSTPDVRPAAPEFRPASPDLRPAPPVYRPATPPAVRPSSPELRPSPPAVRPPRPAGRPARPVGPPSRPQRPTGGRSAELLSQSASGSSGAPRQEERPAPMPSRESVDHRPTTSQELTRTGGGIHG